MIAAYIPVKKGTDIGIESLHAQQTTYMNYNVGRRAFHPKLIFAQGSKQLKVWTH
jgi:hypothetical protein